MTQTDTMTAPANSTAHSSPAPAKPIRMIAIDVDGTLLNSQHQLSQRNTDVIKAAIARGVEVVLATGKTRNAGLWLIEKLGLKSPGIYLQGLYTVAADGRVLAERTLSPDIARQVVTYAEDRGFVMVAYSGTRIMTRTVTQEARDATERYHEPVPEAVGALQNMMGELPIHKLMAVGDPRQISALRWQLGVQLGKSVRLMQAGLANMLEILPAGASKGAALRQLAHEMKCKPDEIMAIGDAENDIEMLQFAGIGVAMGHASENVKQAADHV
ncbi:MAG: Cof-type HAD-IIB family hydrolase, partial [Anaerolinea sp.]|nr:Cof-type HAD-IIB family hydrolase [Anaerolinea sp.]